MWWTFSIAISLLNVFNASSASTGRIATFSKIMDCVLNLSFLLKFLLTV